VWCVAGRTAMVPVVCTWGSAFFSRVLGGWL
jgi:hypothetical protein